MINWVDKSDDNSLFFDGDETEGQSTTEALDDLFNCLRNRIIGSGTTNAFDLLLLEVNCDTGRLLAAATTAESHSIGMVDGCSLRVQEIQDFWYDLLESGPTDEEFTAGVTRYIRNLAMGFREKFISHIDDLRQSCSSSGFTYTAFGSVPGTSIYEERFPMT